VLDLSLSVLLSVTRNCEIALLCTFTSEINDDDDDEIDFSSLSCFN